MKYYCSACERRCQKESEVKPYICGFNPSFYCRWETYKQPFVIPDVPQYNDRFDQEKVELNKKKKRGNK